MQSLDLVTMRRNNADLTLRTLMAGDEPMPVARLTKRTGLSRTTVESILSELIDQRWVRELEGPKRPKAGRPPRAFDVIADRLVLGIVTFTSSHVEGTIVDLRGTPLGSSRVALRDYDDPEITADDGYAALTQALFASGRASDKLRAGIAGTGGAVDERGVVRHLLASPRWNGFDLAGAMSDRSGIPFRAENDANIAAVAEQVAGAARGREDFIWLIAGKRAGMALVVGGGVYHGSEGAAGEFTRSGLFSRLWDPDSDLSHISSPNPDDRQRALLLADAARRGEEAAVVEVDRFAGALGELVATLIWIVAPPLIVLGGGLQDIADLLIPRLAAAMDAQRAPAVEFAASALGRDAAVVGGTHYLLARLEGALVEA